MVATAPKPFTATFTSGSAPDAPDLGYFRRRYPETVASLGALPRREEWLRRIWEAESEWLRARETRGGEAQAEEVVVRGAPPAGREVEAEFDVIYAGGVGLLHAAALACRHGRRVLVFDSQGVGRAQGDWDVSDEELREFERAGLFTGEEIERAVVNRRQGGFVKFHDASSRVKAEPLWVRGVLDVTVEADRLLGLAAEKLRARGPQGCALLSGLRFVRAYVEPSHVTVETEGEGGVRRLFRARLFVDATGDDSTVARQLNGGRAVTHVCPTVGTVARGFVRGAGPDRVDFQTGEIFVSTEDARDHRQLIWTGLPASPARDEYTTRLFFYDAVESPADKSLLSLFERYFESLAAYKRRGAQWRVQRPVFGYAQGYDRAGWRSHRRTADDRVMLLGEAVRSAGTLAFRGFGPRALDLLRLTHLTHLALEADMLDAASLAELSRCGPRAARPAGLTEFLRPSPKSAPSSVNETLNAVMAALHGLDERVRRELFLNRLSFSALRSLLAKTVRLYPRILARVREHLGARDALWWLADVAEAALSERFGRAAARTEDPARPAEDPGQTFARQLALYRKGDGVDEP